MAHNRLCVSASLIALACAFAWPSTGQIISYVHVKTNAALLAAPPFYYPNGVWRDGFNTQGDTPPLFYTHSFSPCPLNAGLGDNGSQVLAADGGCWNAAFTNGVTQGGLRIEWWGVAQTTIGGSPGFTLYVNHAGSDANGNVCVLSAYPCATWQHAVNEGQLFDVEGGNVVIHDTDTTNQNFAESVSVTNPLRGAGNGVAVPNIGNLDPSQIILDGNNHATITGGNFCYGVAASNNAIVGVENITIAPTALACQDGLFAQLGGGINVYGGVTFGATGADGCKLHAENSAYGVEFWQNYSITGNSTCFASIGATSLVLVSAGVGTISGSPAVQEWLFLGADSVFQTNIANPWGSSPGTATGAAFIAEPGSSIEPQGNVITWPGNSTGFLEGGTYDEPPASVPTEADGNIGVGGSLAYSSGGTPYSGAVTITTGSSGTGAAGTVTVTFPTSFSVRRPNGSAVQCSGALIGGGSGTWATGATILGSSIGAGAFTLTWQNASTNLATSKTYSLAYNCPAV